VTKTKKQQKNKNHTLNYCCESFVDNTYLNILHIFVMATPDVFAKCIAIQIKALEEQLVLLREVAAEAEPAAESGKKGKKVKEPVDPNKPKRPHSAYMIFMMEELAKLKLKKPDAQQKDIMSEAAAKWSALDDASKEKYNRAAAVEKIEHEEKMAMYNATLGDSAAAPAPAPVAAAPNAKAKAKPASKKAAEAAPVAVAATAPVEEEKKHHHKEHKDKKRRSEDGSDRHHGDKKKKKKKSSKHEE
jgi:hypothetical protein